MYRKRKQQPEGDNVMKLKSGVYQSCFNIRDTNDNPVECSRDRINQIARISANKDISGAMVFLRLTELINSDFSLNKAGVENAIELISLLRDDQDVIVSIKSNWFGCKKPANAYYPTDWNSKGYGKFFSYDGKTITCLAYWDINFAKDIGEAYGEVANALIESSPNFRAIHWGELSQPTPKGKNEAYLAGVKQVLTSVREISPDVEIGTGPNFIAGDEIAMRDYLKHCEAVGNTITLPPDLIKCRKTGEDGCGPGCGRSKIKAYDYYADYNIRKAGQIQSYDVHWADHKLDYDWALEWGAEVIVQQQMSFWTRDTRSTIRNGDPEWWNYCNELAKTYAPLIKQSKRLDMPDKYSLRPKNHKLPEEYRVFQDSEFGYPIAQITRAKTIDGEKFPPSSFKVIRAHKYSTHQCFFAGYILTYEGSKGVSFLLDADTGAYVKTLEHGLLAAMWMPSTEDNPYLVGIHRRTGTVKKFAVETGELVDLDFDVPSVKGNWTAGKSEGHITPSGKVLYTKESGSYVECILVDFTKKISRSLKLKKEGGSLNTAGISNSGNWIILMLDGKGIYKYKVTGDEVLIPRKKLLHKSHHALLTVDTDNTDVYLVMSVIKSDNSRRVIAYYLDDDREETIVGGPGLFHNGNSGGNKGKALTGHVGLASHGKFCVSFADPQGPHTFGLVDIKTKQFDPIAYCYSPILNGNHHYRGEAHGVASYDGRRAIIAALDNGVRTAVVIDITKLGLSVKPELSAEPDIVDFPVDVDPESPVSPLPEITEPAAERESDPDDVPDGKEGRIRRILAAIKLALERFL